MADTATHPATRILRPSVVEDRTGLSSTTIWRERRAGRFPQPIRLSAKAIGWRESDIERWIESREAR